VEISHPSCNGDQGDIVVWENILVVRNGCRDAGAVLGDVNKVVCASADTINVWDIGVNATPGGSPEDPAPRIRWSRRLRLTPVAW
jgi:hypothetical protein